MYDDYGNGALFALYLVLIPLLFLFAIAGYVIGSFFLMKIFEKAGVQGKWRAWVPVYNLMIFAKLGDLSPWVMLAAVVASAVLGQIPGIGFVFSLVLVAAMVLAGWRVGLKLGKDWPLLLLWLIPGIGGLIWLGILAFSHTPWNPHIPRAAWADSFLKDTVVWDGVPVQPGAPVGPAAAGAAPAGYA
ncbi:MAG: large exoprotein, partial [Microbacterium sp.]